MDFAVFISVFKKKQFSEFRSNIDNLNMKGVVCAEFRMFQVNTNEFIDRERKKSFFF